MGEEKIVFARKASGLVRELGVQDVVLWLAAAPIAGGLFYFMVKGTPLDYPGLNMPLCYVLSGLALIPVAVTLALGSAMLPRSGGMYVPISRSVHPGFGFLACWIHILSRSMVVGLLGVVSSAVLGSILVVAGTVTGNAALMGLGGFLSTWTGKFVFGVTWIILMAVLAQFGMRPVKWFVRILTYIGFAVGIIMMVLLLWCSFQNVPALFDATWGAGAWETIEATAKAEIAIPDFSWVAVFGAFPVALMAYGNWEAITWSSGEIKSPRRSLIIGVIGGFIIVLFMHAALAYCAWSPYGKFLAYYNYVWRNKPDLLMSIQGTIVDPSVPFFFMSLFPDKAIAMLLSVFTIVWFINSMPINFVLASRIFFALAMDRSFPLGFARVSKRGAPTWSNILVGILAFIGVLLVLQEVKVVTAVWSWAAYNVFWMFGLSMMLLPFYRPEIFDRSMARWMIGPVPVLSILGLYTLAVGWWIVEIGIRGFTLPVTVMASIWIAIGAVIFLMMQGKNKKEGIDVTEIYSKIPPE